MPRSAAVDGTPVRVGATVHEHPSVAADAGGDVDGVHHVVGPEAGAVGRR